MSLESAADRSVFVDPADFGRAITWTRAGTPTTFYALFDRPSFVIEDGEQALIDRVARLTCRTSDLPAGAAEDDPVAVAGVALAFACRALRPDRTGMTLVDLKRV